MPNIVLDTNILMEKPEIIKELLNDYNIILSIVTVEELDNLKISQNADKAYKARQAIKQIENNLDNIYVDIERNTTLEMKNDNIILSCAKRNNALIGTLDLNMKIKAKGLGIGCFEFADKNKEEYLGYKEVEFDEFELANFYECMINKWGLLENEYLILKDLDGNILDCWKWKNGFKQLNKKTFKSVIFGDKIKPKDIHQEMVFDSLLNDKFTVISGLAGSGKSLLSLVYCTWALQNNKYEKMILAFNPTKLKGSSEMGFYSGDVIQKGLQQFVGNMLNSKFGDPMVVNGLINQGKLQLVPISDIRGMEITDSQILYITEAQNLSIDLCKTCIQRASENAKIIFEGDIKSQVDNKLFEGNNNGLKRTIEVFKGESMFGYVYLPKIYRSRIADIAERM